jgi:hypothetical protein
VEENFTNWRTCYRKCLSSHKSYYISKLGPLFSMNHYIPLECAFATTQIQSTAKLTPFIKTN